MEMFRNNLKVAKALKLIPNLLRAGFIPGGSGKAGSWLRRIDRREIR